MSTTASYESIVNLANSWRVNRVADLIVTLRSLVGIMSGMQDGSVHIPSETIALLKNFGVFRSARPSEDDGLDFNPMQQTRIIEEISRIDTSLGWRCMIGMDSGIYFRYLDRSTAMEIFPDPDSIAAGWIFPAGKAHVTKDGYRVDGTWRFGSGIDLADIVIGGCFVYKDGELEMDVEGQPRTTIIIAPQKYFTIDMSSWNVHGLRSSGSFDYSVKELIVKSIHSFNLKAPIHSGPLTRRDDALVRKMPGVALGAMRSMLDYVYRNARSADDQQNRDWINSPYVQSAIAQYEYSYLAVRSAVYSSLEEEWHSLCKGEAVSNACRAMLAVSRRQAFRAAREMASGLFDLAGSSSIYVANTPLDRHLRDITVACQHAVAKERIDVAAGALLLGEDKNEIFV